MPLLVNIELDQSRDHVFGPGETVKGKVVVAASQQEEIRQLKVQLRGISKTRITRSNYMGNGSHTTSNNERLYIETVPLFVCEETVVKRPCTLAANTHSWDFQFTFPCRSETKYKGPNGKHFSRDPHVLPNSFQTTTQDGAGMIQYSVQAKLVLQQDGLNRATVKASQMVSFARKGRPYAPPRTRQFPLNVQSWKCGHLVQQQQQQQQGEAIKGFAKASRFLRNEDGWRTPQVRFIPIVHAPRAVAPRQRIPIALSVKRVQRSTHDANIDSLLLTHLQVDITTRTHLSRGGMLARSGESMERTVRCIHRENCDIVIPADQTLVQLVHDFRLVDNAEAVPTFRSYIMSRLYVLTVKATLAWKGKTWDIASSSEMEILPRCQQSIRRSLSTGFDDVDPLPLYTPPDESVPSYDELDFSSSSSSSSTNGEYFPPMGPYPDEPPPRFSFTLPVRPKASQRMSLPILSSIGRRLRDQDDARKKQVEATQSSSSISSSRSSSTSAAGGSSSSSSEGDPSTATTSQSSFALYEVDSQPSSSTQTPKPVLDRYDSCVQVDEHASSA